MAAAKYQEIATALRVQITRGELSIGEQLPTERALQGKFGASRTTVRQALKDLRDEGLVRMYHGVGVFVAPPRIVHRLDSRERLTRARRARDAAGFRAEAEEQGFIASSETTVWFESAGDYAEALGIAEDSDVCVRDRVLHADGEPVMRAISRLPREITRGTQLEQQDTGPGGILARLGELGHEITSYEEVVAARLAQPAERQLLNLTDEPVLAVRRTTYGSAGVLEINDMALPAQSYELRYSWASD